jgi:hypothetical protein
LFLYEWTNLIRMSQFQKSIPFERTSDEENKRGAALSVPGGPSLV